MTSATSLLGLEGFLDQEQIQALIDSLSVLWQLSMNAEPSDLEADLEASKRWFDPVAQGQRLRRELAEIPPVPEGVVDPGHPFTLQIAPNHVLVTPEGRCALDLLQNLPTDRKGSTIADTHLMRYDRLLAQLYRDWSRHRISSVIALLSGQEKPLQIPAAGVVLALLVNRSTSKDRALRRFASGTARDVVDGAFFEAVNEFASALSPRQRPTRDPRLVSGWMLYEARRRLGYDVLIIESSRPDSDGLVWIEEARQNHAIEVVARDLARGHRASITPNALERAFDALVVTFRSVTEQLAGYGLAHERPSNTERLRQILESRFAEHTD